MSQAYAIAATAAVLQRLLQAGYTDLKVDDLLNGETATVRCIAPERIVADAAGSTLDLILYNQTRNTGWSNLGLPSRDVRGERTANPALALDLQFLLCAWGGSDFHAEILLGAAMQVLHETPALGRDAIRQALNPGPGTPLLPKELALAGLADQFEQLRITPLNLSTDELSRIWAALQVPARPCAAYTVSVVLIEAQRSARAALPVTQRTLVAQTLRAPRIDRVEAATGPATPVLASGRVRILGAQLKAPNVRVLVSGIDVSDTITDADNESLLFALSRPTPPPAGPVLPVDGLRAGVNTVQVQQPQNLGVPAVPHVGSESNLAAFVLDPQAVFTVPPGGASLVRDGVTYRSGRIDVGCTPRVGSRQRVTLLLNEAAAPSDRPSRAYSFAAPAGNGVVAPAEDTDTVSISVSGVALGSYLARLRVDAGTSPLTVDAGGAFNGPLVAP
jgi:hypothetical protein